MLGSRLPPRVLVFALRGRTISPLLNPVGESLEHAGISGARREPFLKPHQCDKLLGSTKKSSICHSLCSYQKVQGGCIISYVGMLVTLTGMEMTAQGSPCCSRERLIMYPSLPSRKSAGMSAVRLVLSWIISM